MTLAVEQTRPAAQTAEPESDFEQLLKREFRPSSAMESFIAKKDGFWSIANAIHKSRLAQHLASPEAVFAVMLYGYRFGWDAWTSIQNCHIINGKVSQSAASMLSIALENGGRVKIEEAGRDGQTGNVGEWVRVTLSRDGHPPVVKTWTQADVKRAGLGGNHGKYPAQMLQWRAVADACRVLFADKLAGIRASEEISHEIAQVSGADPTWVEKQPKKQNPFRQPSPEPERAPAGSQHPPAADSADPPAAEDLDPRTPAQKAEEYSQNVPPHDLRNWLMKLPAKVRQAALERAGVKTLVDAPDKDIQATAFAAKLAEYTD